MKIVLPSLFRTNKALLPVKIHFFLFYAATGCGLPFRTVYAKQLGIAGSAIGIAFAATSFFRLFTNPLFGILLDKFKKFRLTVAISLVLVSTSHLALIYIPSAAKEDSSNGKMNCTCGSEDSAIRVTGVWSTLQQLPSETFTDNAIKPRDVSQSIPHCTGFVTRFNYTKHGRSNVELSDNITKDHYRLNQSSRLMCSCCNQESCMMNWCTNNGSSPQVRINSPLWNSITSLPMQFWSFLVLMLISASSATAVIFLMDAMCYEILAEKPENYGAQRLFGTMGWGVGGLIGGYFNQLFTGKALDTNYSPCFYLLAAISLVDVIPILFLKTENAKYSPGVWKEAKCIMSQASVIAYIIMVFFIGVLSGPVWNYGFWFLEEIGASQLLLGLAHIVECFVAEIPCFLMAGWVIKKIGYINCNSVALTFFGLRYLCFYYMFDPWWSLPVGLLHGPTYGLFYASATTFAKKNAPPGTENTAQAIIAAAFESLGVAIGSVFGGVGFDIIGYRTTFLCASIGSFVLLLINVILLCFLPVKDSTDDSCTENMPETMEIERRCVK